MESYLAFGENTHTLRLTSELVDLRVGYATPLLRRGRNNCVRSRSSAAIKNAPLEMRGAFFMARGYEKDIFVVP